MSEGFRIETPGLSLLWGDAVAGTGSIPHLREQTPYTVLLRSRSNAPVGLEHRDPNLLRALRTTDDGRMVWGTINFGSQVGRSSFALHVGGTLEREFEVEVVPTKLAYRDDYHRLVEETREILAGLVWEYLRSTFHAGGSAPVAPTRVEWLTLLRNAADDLERALDHVARHPLWGVARDPHPVRAEYVRRPNMVLRGRGAGHVLRLAAGTTLRERVQERRPRPTLDTPEHRWIASQVRRIRRGLARVRQEQRGARPSPRRERILEEIEALERRFARMAGMAPLAVAGEQVQAGFASLQLLRQPGYSEAYAACGLLARGLHLQGGPVRLALKDLHLLYEQWCYLALLGLLAEQMGTPMPGAQLLTTEEHGLRVVLRHGRAHRVVLDGPGGLRVALTYNPRFAGDPLLVPQQPDFLLEIHAPGKAAARLLLDAKYRIDASPEYCARYGSPGPPEDALNGLHRYRDALRANEVIALFPHRDVEPGSFRASRLRCSIERLGIGALPFLPGETGYVAEWLQGVLRQA